MLFQAFRVFCGGLLRARLWCRLARLFLAFGMLLFAFSAQAGWDKPKYPVIFIHGINSNAQDTWGDFVLKAWSNGWTYGGTFSHTGFLPSTMGIITFSKPLTYPKLDLNYSYSLTVHRADFYTLTFSSPQDLSFSQQGKELADVISAVVAANVAADPTRNKVILVAHSMGGLAARAYLQSQTGRDRDNVDALITVGTPHLGTWAANACADLPTGCGVFGNGLRGDSEAVTELAPKSDAFKNPTVGLNTTITSDTSLPGGVNTYVSIVVTGKSMDLINGSTFGQGDGIVPEDSQNFDNVAGFKALAKNHFPEPITLYDWSPGCIRFSISSIFMTLAEFHTCETENPSVQDAIQRWIAMSGLTFKFGSPPIVTTDSAFVTAGSTPQVIVKGSAAHSGPVTNTHLVFNTTLAGLTSFNVAQQQTSIPANLVEKSSSALTSSQIVQQTSTPAVSVQEFSAALPGPLVPGQTYYYQFIADADGYTSYGQVHEVTIPPAAGIGGLLPAPTGLLPATGAIDQTLTPTLRWNQVAGAASYRFMLAQNADALPIDPTDGNCDRCLVDTVVPTALGITYQPKPGVLNAGTTYYWQVHARGADNFGAWRSVDGSGVYVDAASFTTAMPTPATLLPVPTPTTPDGATGLSTTPTLSWTPDAGAASYRIMIATNAAAITTDPTSADCTTCVVNVIVSGGSSSTYVPDLGILAPGTTYYWSVKARSENYYGAWSPVRSFSTGALAPIGTVTEFSVGIVSGASLYEITAGPDGNLWFTIGYSSQIGRITPAGVVTEFSGGTNGWNYGITAGPDGNLWFTENFSDRIGRITPAGVVTEFNTGIFFNAGVRSITAGADGNLWFTENWNGYGSTIGRITPSGVVTEFSNGISYQAGVWAITAGPDGNLWFTEMGGASGNPKIGRITPTGVVTEFSAGITSYPYAITAGPDGNLWFTEYQGNRIGRITPAGVITEFSAGISANAYPHSITAGPDGNLWFTESGVNRIGRITPIGVVTEFSVGNAGPEGITAGPDGNIWFTEPGANRIGRITSGVGTTTYTLNVSSVNGTVTSAPAGINCGATCSAGFALGTSVTLSATPNAGSKFNGWSGAGCSGTGTCQVTMNGATTVNATFSPVTIPNPPTVTGITLGQGNVVLTFIAPPGNGGSTITGYTATCTTPGGSTGTMTGTGSPLTVSGLTIGLGYSCTIAANNSVGTSASTTALAYPPPASQSISFGVAPTVVVGGTGTISATGGASGNAVTFSSTTTGVCTVSGTSVTGVSAGTCTIAADQAGNGSYAAALQVLQNFAVTAPAFSIIDHYYQDILNRQADAGGKAFWQSEATRMSNQGVSDSEAYVVMAKYFFSSPEFLARGFSDDQFVRNLYLTFFNRGADQGGLDYWKSVLTSGLPRDMVMYAFMFSPEFSSFMIQNVGLTYQRAEVGAVVDYYRGAFGRLPDDGGLKYWVNQFRSAQCSANPAGSVYSAAISIAGGFFGSADYWSGSPSASKDVSDQYNAFMRRSADLAGFNYWVNQLSTNAQTYNQVRQSFIDSPEFAARVQAIVNQGCTALMQ